jgi:hypothetical protein
VPIAVATIGSASALINAWMNIDSSPRSKSGLALASSPAKHLHIDMVGIGHRVVLL